MDPEPAAGSRTSDQVEMSSRASNPVIKEGIDDEDPFSLSGTSIALFGLAMAIAVVGLPLLAVLTDRPMGKESLAPNTFKSDGSKSSFTFSLPRFGKSRR